MHHTLNVLLHHLVKYKCSKMTQNVYKLQLNLNLLKCQVVMLLVNQLLMLLQHLLTIFIFSRKNICKLMCNSVPRRTKRLTDTASVH